MRLTWLVLGVVLAAGALAFLNTAQEEEPLPAAGPETGVTGPALKRETGPAKVGQHLLLDAATEKAEKRAVGLLQAIGRAQAAGDATKRAALESTLRQEAWDAPSARRYAYRRGRALLEQADGQQGAEAIATKDRARRYLSRVLYLPEMFDEGGAPTDERTKLIDVIQRLNRQVMHYGPGVPGVTAKYEVERGIRPVQIVSREKLPMGSNAILFWNQGGNLDPKRLRAGQTILLPREELSLHVHRRWRRMGVFIGGWFVKEFSVGIGKEETPTPPGTFWVHSREKNPDWWKPGGKKIPYGHPDNELGSAWIAIESDEWPLSAGYGLHGTNKPSTVGTRCSNGCVRVQNAEATELYDWVRTGSAGGRATRIYIR